MNKVAIQAEIARLQAQEALLNTIAEDSFPFGTIVVFSPQAGNKWFYIKVAEETWKSLTIPNNGTLSLAEWILAAKESNIGYFEVYVMITEETPFYASA